jgi:hypothetical protein
MNSSVDFLIGFVGLLTLVSAVLGLVLDVWYTEATLLGITLKASEPLTYFDAEAATLTSIVFAAFAIVSSTAAAIFSLGHTFNMFEMRKRMTILISFILTGVFSGVAWITFLAHAENNSVEVAGVETGYEVGFFFLIVTMVFSIAGFLLGWNIEES